MAKKKELIKITSNRLRTMSSSTFTDLSERDGMYGQEVFFTDGYDERVYYLYQCLGNIGAHPNRTIMEPDIEYMVVSDKIITYPLSELSLSFIMDYEKKINQTNSAFQRVRIITEHDLIKYLKNRAIKYDDHILLDLVSKYNHQPLINPNPTLF
jgi:hypothetical protein